jgi:hypothetical protein
MPATSTLTRTPPKPATGRCSLALRINGVKYLVKPLPVDFGGLKAFRLTKPDGEFHDILRDVHGPSCTCGDFVFRRDGIDEAGCKHIRASRACGLLD